MALAKGCLGAVLLIVDVEPLCWWIIGIRGAVMVIVTVHFGEAPLLRFIAYR